MSHLCVSSRAQDVVTALTFQAERVPVLAQGAHLLGCEGQVKAVGDPATARGSPPPDRPAQPLPLRSLEVMETIAGESAPRHGPGWKTGPGSAPSPASRVLGDPVARFRPFYDPCFAGSRISPKKTGCWQRGQVQLIARDSLQRALPARVPGSRPLC